MNSRRMTARRSQEGRVNEEIPPLVEQVEQVLQGAQGVQVPIVEEGNDVSEDPHEFLDGVYKVLSVIGVNSREKAELDSYQLRDVAQVWYIQWKDNRSVESGPIEWEEFKEALLGKYFPRERREVKVEEFINLKQGNMSVEEYSLKFTMLYRYSPSLVSKPRHEMSRFVTAVADLVKEEYCTAMLHGDVTFSRLMVYAQSIEESKHSRISRNLKRSGQGEKNQSKFKKNVSSQDEPRGHKVKLEKCSGSQGSKPNCATCGKRHSG
ncbi:uncharacterized protein [Solanum lycopersicum]|uniref:uncharacterized protein n=1 Tax=Solanum lycopersicum TaxID=4081 RepID=UPI003747E1A3